VKGVGVMREIKFRGKRVDNGEWVFGGIVKIECAVFINDKTKER